jgi:sugar phosphate isomerase/epimerase
MTDFSYQLYSSRNFPPLDSLQKRLGALGYKNVEGYGGLFAGVDDLGALAASLTENGLHMRSSHIGLDMVEDDTAQMLKIAKTLGVKEIYVPFLQPDDRPTDAAGWRAFGARLVEAGKPVRDAGMIFGWHNHAFEFEALPTGELPMDLVLEGNDLSFEFDVAWADVAGSNPLDTIAKYGSRITAAHVKDRAPAGENADEDGWADVGHGTLDWANLYAALTTAGCTNFVMEHDNPSDDQRFASRALAHMQSLT